LTLRQLQSGYVRMLPFQAFRLPVFAAFRHGVSPIWPVFLRNSIKNAVVLMQINETKLEARNSRR